MSTQYLSTKVASIDLSSTRDHILSGKEHERKL
jgi:hypothetical protein